MGTSARKKKTQRNEKTSESGAKRVFDHENFFQRSARKQNLNKLKQKKYEKDIKRNTEKQKISQNSKILLEQRNLRILQEEIRKVAEERDFLNFRDLGEVLSGLGFLRLLSFDKNGGKYIIERFQFNFYLGFFVITR